MKYKFNKRMTVQLILIVLIVAVYVIGAYQSKKAHALHENQEAIFSSVFNKFLKKNKISDKEIHRDFELSIDLHKCTDDKLGLKILCNPRWDFREEENVLMLIINKKPDVTMTLVKIDSDIDRIDKLTKENLNALGQYGYDFQYKQTKIAGLDAVNLQSYSDQNPRMKVSDYYFVNDNSLYGLLFSVEPGDQWGNYQVLFDKIANSLEII